MTVDVAADNGPGGVNAINTITQGSAENSASSQISSVSFSSHDHPQSAGAFSQAISNGRNNNRLVHSTSSVTSGQQGTTSRASSYAIAISSSSRNFDLPFINPAAVGGEGQQQGGNQSQDKQIYDEEFIVPSELPQTKSRAPPSSRRSGGSRYTEGRPYYQRPAPSLVLSSPPSSTTTTTTTASTPTYVVRRPAPTLVVGNINNNHNNNNHNTHRDYYSNNNYNNHHNYQQHPNYTNNPSNFLPDETGHINRNSSDYRKYFRHFDSWGSN